jgi:bacteriophage exclusion system BrxA-like protein
MTVQKATKQKGVSASASPPYTSRIIKAGALLDDTKTLLSHWDVTASVPENLDRIRRENVFGKASRSRVEDILAIFRQRYLTEAEVTKALVVLVKDRLPAASLDRVLYFHAARADRLLHDTVTEVLMPKQAQGITEIDLGELQRSVGIRDVSGGHVDDRISTADERFPDQAHGRVVKDPQALAFVWLDDEDGVGHGLPSFTSLVVRPLGSPARPSRC